MMRPQMHQGLVLAQSRGFPLLSALLVAAAVALLAACGPAVQPEHHAPPKAAASASTPLTADEQALQARLPEKVESDTTHAWVMDAILGKPRQVIKTIGILENGKLNAAEMLHEVAALFEARHGGVVRPIYSKTNASAPAQPGVLEKVAGEVDFMITGLGD